VLLETAPGPSPTKEDEAPMKAKPKRKTKCAALQAPHGFEIPSAAQFEEWYGADVVSTIVKIQQEQNDTDCAPFKKYIDSLMQEYEEGNRLAGELLIFLNNDLKESMRILKSDLDEEIRTRLLLAHTCAARAFLDSLESD
jgi:hypothetical protein